MWQPETWGGQILRAGAAVTLGFCLGLGNSKSSHAFDSQFDTSTKSNPSRDTISFKGRARNSAWLSINADGSVSDLNPFRTDAVTAYGLKMPQPIGLEKSAVADTRISLGIWDDWLRVTSRQAVSNYVKPGSDLGYLKQTGLDSGATSQGLETYLFKNGSTGLSLFTEYAKVGASFVAPEFVIKRQDSFFKPNSTTTRFGSAIEQGPITLSLEQRSQQSLAQKNAPILVQNQIGVSFSLDNLFHQGAGERQGVLLIVPSSGWFNVGQGRMSATLSPGVVGSTLDTSVGLSWNLGNVYANIGFWHSAYQSQLYPWTGSGINGSVGYNQGLSGVDLYFNVDSSSVSFSSLQPVTTQTLDVTSGLLLRTRF